MFFVRLLTMKRVFIDMDNVLVDFQSGLDQVSEEKKAEYAGRLDEIQGLFALMSITTCLFSLQLLGRIRRHGRTRWIG